MVWSAIERHIYLKIYLFLQRLIWSTCLAARLAAGSGPETSGPEPDHAGDSPFNPLPYGHPYPGLGHHLGPFPKEQIKIVYVEKPASPQWVTFKFGRHFKFIFSSLPLLVLLPMKVWQNTLFWQKVV